MYLDTRRKTFVKKKQKQRISQGGGGDCNSSPLLNVALMLEIVGTWLYKSLHKFIIALSFRMTYSARFSRAPIERWSKMNFINKFCKLVFGIGMKKKFT